ncbi:hypothetical protein BJV74DRAFT_798590 [Russula compacta]|nr:hypothetical protein BJV74DRAFT_798590 [Russula compacta]
MQAYQPVLLLLLLMVWVQQKVGDEAKLRRQIVPKRSVSVKMWSKIWTEGSSPLNMGTRARGKSPKISFSVVLDSDSYDYDKGGDEDVDDHDEDDEQGNRDGNEESTWSSDNDKEDSYASL